jgi:hypothetical protein
VSKTIDKIRLVRFSIIVFGTAALYAIAHWIFPEALSDSKERLNIPLLLICMVPTISYAAIDGYLNRVCVTVTISEEPY